MDTMRFINFRHYYLIVQFKEPVFQNYFIGLNPVRGNHLISTLIALVRG
jgi:hypothetical protein